AVAGVVPVRGAVLVALAVTALAAGAGAAFGAYGIVQAGAAVVLALCAAELLLRHCVHRFGGVTGDVFGGLEETAATAALVVLSLG
ncbi:adenosylcobinamide-GDP ribazoletransferase, partial [Streptomyces sp. NPDC050211]|uniref:adenosylcobinamide-GDP ribazoletransferase n=1 Tax=Streptomyces sp. NPDC050211 TaxID=3154932 RepID=UPI00343CFEA6